jgi:hypothetical protein
MTECLTPYRRVQYKPEYNFGNGDQAELWDWLDTIPLSKARKNLAKDFSDGVNSCRWIKSEMTYFFLGTFNRNHPSF